MENNENKTEERDKRLYPISEEYFDETVKPVIEKSYIGKGRPPEISHYAAFCGILYVLRTGCPWRELPKEYGPWHTIYDRHNRGSARGLWVQVLAELQKRLGTHFREIISDGTIVKIHRHGGGRKGGIRAKGSRRLV
jgi:transposase